MGKIPPRIHGNDAGRACKKDRDPEDKDKRIYPREAERKEVHEGHYKGSGRQGRGFRGVFKGRLKEEI